MQVVPTVTGLVLRQVGVSSCCCLACSFSVHPEEGWCRSLSCLNGFRRSLRGIGALSSKKVRAMLLLPSNPVTRVQNKIWSAEQPGRNRWFISASCQQHDWRWKGTVAPADDATLSALKDPERRPPVLRDRIPEDILSTRPEVPFNLDSDRLARNIRCARQMVRSLTQVSGHRHFVAAAACRSIDCVWVLSSNVGGSCPGSSPCGPRGSPRGWTLSLQGWQHVASACVEDHFFQTVVLPRCLPPERALLRSQGGPLSGLPFVACPSSPHQRFVSHLFRVLLLRGLHLPSCRCGHRTSCPTSGVLGRRGFALESAAARVCREASARVRTNVFVRDLDLLPQGVPDQRRLEVVAEGLPLFHGAQLAIDTTLVSPLRADGAPHIQCADVDGAALRQARRQKERTYPELSGAHGRVAGLLRRRPFCGCWCAPKPVHCQRSSECELVKHGFSGGALCWRVPQLGHTLLPCLSSMAVLGQMVPLLRPPLCWTGAGCRVTRCSCVSWFALRPPDCCK